MGENWLTTTDWPGYYVKSIIVNSSDDVFIATFHNGMMRSTDGGMTFQEINNGLAPPMIRCLNLLENDYLLIGTSDGLFRSVDNGDSWEPFGNGIPDDWIEEISIGDNGKMVAGMLNTGVFLSTDSGANWTYIGEGLPDTTQVTSILAVPGETILYAALFPQGVFCSLDDGDTWFEHNEGLPFGVRDPGNDRDFSIHGLTKIQQFIFMYIYAYLVFYNELMGNPALLWNPLFGGLPQGAEINSFSAMLLTMVICGTLGTQDAGPIARGPGIYINAVPVDISSPASPGSRLNLSVINNPCRDVIKIIISMPEEERISLTLISQTGQEINQLKDGILSDGKHEFNLSTGNLDPGMYLLKLAVKNQILTRKIICY
jgi:hypothetical protein